MSIITAIRSTLPGGMEGEEAAAALLQKALGRN